MALKTDKSRTYERVVTDPEDGTEYTITYRKLTYGDIEDRRSASVKIGKKNKGNRWSAKAQDAFTIRRSVVSWDFPFPCTEQDIMELDYDIARQINTHLAEINPSLKNELNLFEMDEDEDEETEDETNGHHEEPSFAVVGVDEGATVAGADESFGENEGPTQSAEPS